MNTRALGNQTGPVIIGRLRQFSVLFSRTVEGGKENPGPGCISKLWDIIYNKRFNFVFGSQIMTVPMSVLCAHFSSLQKVSS